MMTTQGSFSFWKTQVEWAVQEWTKSFWIIETSVKLCLGILTQSLIWYLKAFSLALPECNRWAIETLRLPEQLSSECVPTKVTSSSFQKSCGWIAIKSFFWRFPRIPPRGRIPQKSYFQRDESLLRWTSHWIIEICDLQVSGRNKKWLLPSETSKLRQNSQLSRQKIHSFNAWENTKRRFHKNVYKNSLKTSSSPSLKVGEYVRIAKVTTSFCKGYRPQFTNEIFEIIDNRSTVPRVFYELEDLKGEKVLGNFHHEQLSRHCSSIRRTFQTLFFN